MGSLASLRRSSALTVLLVFGFLLLIFLLVLILPIVIVLLFVRDNLVCSFCFPFIPNIIHMILIYGFALLLTLTAIVFLFQWLASPWLICKAAGIRKEHRVTKKSNPFLYKTVRGLCRKAKVPMPVTVVIPDKTPNAFVFGRTRYGTCLVLHRGLLRRLNKDEVRAVIAHEIGHIKHRDVVSMTVVSATPLIVYVFGSFFFAQLEKEDDEKEGAGNFVGSILTLIAATIAYTFYEKSQRLVLNLSQLREYYADSYSAALTGKPRDLISALTKITFGLSLASSEEPNGVRAFYVGDPVKAADDKSIMKEKLDKYDINKDGVLDEKELEVAMDKEAMSSWRSERRLRDASTSLQAHPHAHGDREGDEEQQRSQGHIQICVIGPISHNKPFIS